MKNQSHPIVIVKKRKHKGGGHGAHGSWKIAYADFMTAMMAFFLVMWLISISSPKELIQIAEYFRTPLATAVTGGQRIANSDSPIPGGGDDYTQQKGEVKKEPNIDELKRRMEQARLKKLRGDLDQLIEADPKLRALRPHLKIDLVQEGLRIQIIDSQNRPMFKTGSAEVEPYMRDILRAIAPVLNGIPNRVSLSGHTDDFPYATGERDTATGNFLPTVPTPRVASWWRVGLMMARYCAWSAWPQRCASPTAGQMMPSTVVSVF
jgi:chemotaxis protein MotB